MGVDYLARKGAKKNRKKLNENLKPRRERKKKVARRLCRGVCYQEPAISAEDLGDENSKRHSRSLAGSNELAKAKQFLNDKKREESQAVARQAAATKSRQASKSSTETVDAATARGGKRSITQPSQRRSTPNDAEASKDLPSRPVLSQPSEGDVVASVEASKRRRLSTSVNLLDAKSAKGETKRIKKNALPDKGQGSNAAETGAIPDCLQALPDLVQRYMIGEGFAEPMPVQARCWPVLLEGLDAEVVAEPGAGKTLGYLLPGAELLARHGHGAESQPEAPLMLVVLPTRELAQQVAASCRELRKYSGLRTVCLTGGSDREEQVAALSGRHPHVVVATPGRLLDLAKDGSLSLGAVQYVVLDEADKMLGMGFQPQIQRLKDLLMPASSAAPSDEDRTTRKLNRAQVCLFTATLPDSLSAIAAPWLNCPERIRVSHSAACISRTVTQVVQVCAEHKKPAKLAKHLAQIKESSNGLRNPPRIIIFANRIKTVRFLHKQVLEAGFRAAVLHGDRTQEERELAMHDFRSGKVQILVATDVAARGLHIRGLPFVVNYDFPTNLEQYIHRVGRTGRLATDGHAFSFFTRELAPLAPQLLELLEAHQQAVDPNLVKLIEAYKVAAERLGLLAAAAGDEEPARPQTDDVLRTLGLKTRQQRKKGNGKAGKHGDASGCATRGDDDGTLEKEERLGEVCDRNLEAPDTVEKPYFIASKNFRGAKQGFAYKKGIKGLGYYLDTVQLAPGSKKTQQSAHQHQHQKQLVDKYAHTPVGGTQACRARSKAGAARGPAGPSGDVKGRTHHSALMQEKGNHVKKSTSLLPGQKWKLLKQEQAESDHEVLAASCAQDGQGGAEPSILAAGRSTRKRALPGRIRKKLASQRTQP